MQTANHTTRAISKYRQNAFAHSICLGVLHCTSHKPGFAISTVTQRSRDFPTSRRPPRVARQSAKPLYLLWRLALVSAVTDRSKPQSSPVEWPLNVETLSRVLGTRHEPVVIKNF